MPGAVGISQYRSIELRRKNVRCRSFCYMHRNKNTRKSGENIRGLSAALPFKSTHTQTHWSPPALPRQFPSCAPPPVGTLSRLSRWLRRSPFENICIRADDAKTEERKIRGHVQNPTMNPKAKEVKTKEGARAKHGWDAQELTRLSHSTATKQKYARAHTNLVQGKAGPRHEHVVALPHQSRQSHFQRPAAARAQDDVVGRQRSGRHAHEFCHLVINFKQGKTKTNAR